MATVVCSSAAAPEIEVQAAPILPKEGKAKLSFQRGSVHKVGLSCLVSVGGFFEVVPPTLSGVNFVAPTR